MSAFVNLVSGGSVVVWQTASGISFQRYDASFHAIGAVGTFAATSRAWLSVTALSNGGFTVIWDSNSLSTPNAQDFDASGIAVGSTYGMAAAPTAQIAAFTTRDQPSTVVLADGCYVVATSPSNTSVHIQRYDSAGNPAGPEFVDSAAATSYTAAQVTPISDGGYLVTYAITTSTGSAMVVHRFRPDGTWQSTSEPTAYNGAGAPTLANQAIAALPEGGFVVVWTSVDASGAHVHRMEFDGAGATLVADQILGDVASNSVPTIDVFPTGRYEISWTAPAGVQNASFTRASGAVTPGSNDLIKVGLTSYTLPIGPHNVLLVGTSAQTVTGNGQDNTITANETLSTLNGAGGNDTLIASHTAVILSGGSGADKFVYPYLPWSAGHITDFTLGTDRLNFSALFSASGYSGSNPVADGYMRFDSDGAGGTVVYYDADGPAANASWTQMTTLDHVSPNGLTAAALFGQASGAAHVVADFNNDQHTDILWQSVSGQAAVWTMNGVTQLGGAAVGDNPGTSWRPVGAGDFNGDGKPDVLWQSNSGLAAIWLINGTSFASGGAAGPNPGSAWHAIACGDFNGDGYADILWQNDDGSVAVWLMNGFNMIAGGQAGPNPGTAWHAIGTGDFNGDGKSDILWQNTSGLAAVWLMNGTSMTSGGAAGPNPGTTWHVKAAGDFNADGKSDILWQNDNGLAGVWFMNGSAMVSGGALDPNPGTAWHVIGAGDFNSDGKADIEWQNADGSPAVWLMNGTTFLSGAVLANPGTSWHMIATGF